MKTTLLKISFIFLLLSLMGAGCEKEEELVYKGKVVSLNNGNGCNNIIEVVSSVNNGSLTIGATLTFDPESYKGKLNEGDVVRFKIIQYEEWSGHATANCLWPQFTAQIEFYNN